MRSTPLRGSRQRPARRDGLVPAGATADCPSAPTTGGHSRSWAPEFPDHRCMAVAQIPKAPAECSRIHLGPFVAHGVPRNDPLSDVTGCCNSPAIAERRCLGCHPDPSSRIGRAVPFRSPVPTRCNPGRTSAPVSVPASRSEVRSTRSDACRVEVTVRQRFRARMEWTGCLHRAEFDEQRRIWRVACRL